MWGEVACDVWNCQRDRSILQFVRMCLWDMQVAHVWICGFVTPGMKGGHMAGGVSGTSTKVPTPAATTETPAARTDAAQEVAAPVAQQQGLLSTFFDPANHPLRFAATGLAAGGIAGGLLGAATASNTTLSASVATKAGIGALAGVLTLGTIGLIAYAATHSSPATYNPGPPVIYEPYYKPDYYDPPVIYDPYYKPDYYDPPVVYDPYYKPDYGYDTPDYGYDPGYDDSSTYGNPDFE
jgi:hypothetical protein